MYPNRPVSHSYVDPIRGCVNTNISCPVGNNCTSFSCDVTSGSCKMTVSVIGQSQLFLGRPLLPLSVPLRMAQRNVMIIMHVLLIIAYRILACTTRQFVRHLTSAPHGRAILLLAVYSPTQVVTITMRVRSTLVIPNKDVYTPLWFALLQTIRVNSIPAKRIWVDVLKLL